MLQRVMLTAVLASWAVAPAMAQTRATYALTNGEKYNGVIVYGRGDNNPVDNKFHVNKSGNELVFERADVVVIDFVDDTPAAAERQGLPSGTGLMVMRDGTLMRGSLHDIRKGDIVQWVNETGRRDNYPIAGVRRLYLNPDVARNVFFNATPAAGGAPARTRQDPFGRQRTTVRVDGNQAWVDTGLDVGSGDRLTFNASGQIQIAPGSAVNASGAAGRSGTRRPATNANYPIPNMGAGGLIARVGDGMPFAIGAGSREITMPAAGRLLLGINDDNVSDNSGAFTVTVRR